MDFVLRYRCYKAPVVEGQPQHWISIPAVALRLFWHGRFVCLYDQRHDSVLQLELRCLVVSLFASQCWLVMARRCVCLFCSCVCCAYFVAAIYVVLLSSIVSASPRCGGRGLTMIAGQWVTDVAGAAYA